MKRMMNELEFRLKEKHTINEILYYDTEGEKLFVHWKESNLSPLKQAKKFIEGLSNLADEVMAKPELEEIKYIFAISNMVKEHPEKIENLGFKVFDFGDDERNTEEMEKAGIIGYKTGLTTEEERVAVISRDSFLTRPWERKGERDADQ